MCGERQVSDQSSLTASGSSPRVRGTRPQCLRQFSGGRFIPACAGNAQISPVPMWIVAVHPRVCGERPAMYRDAHFAVGSSPRVRGTRVQCGAARNLATVHPRVCGERETVYQLVCRALGSSPRVRGTQSRDIPRRQSRRFIPACAGNATSGSPSTQINSVHPRVCGERITSQSGDAILNGSSPRVRGTLARQ